MSDSMNNLEIISITEKARERMHLIAKKSAPDSEHGIRIGVVGGGCSGLSYHIDFDLPKEHDNIIDLGGVRVLIDPKSAIYLKETVLEFQDGLQGKGFIFKNPNATNTCGCGESFSV